jgi:formate hydrogenlyase transcriptional activator
VASTIDNEIAQTGEPSFPLVVSRAQIRREDEFLAGGGEMGGRIRYFDWATTHLGPITGWPQSVRAAVALCVKSPLPTILTFGPKHVTIYNDAFIPMLGDKHPAGAFARPSAECWPEIGHIMGPMLDGVLDTGRAVLRSNVEIDLQHEGLVEENYFTMTFAPILAESGHVAGCFGTAINTTDQTVGDRRLCTLRDLAARAGEAKEPEDIYRHAADVLAANPYDIPFALFYLLDDSCARARLVSTAGIEPGTPASPTDVALARSRPTPAAWPLARIAAGGSAEVVNTQKFGRLPRGAWPDPPRSGLVLPIRLPGHHQPKGLFVAALSPRRALDAAYRAFFDSIVGHIAGSYPHLSPLPGATRSQRFHQALLENERRIAAILTNSPNQIFIKDTQGRYLLINKAFEASFRVSQEDAHGRTDEELFAPQQVATLRSNDLKVINSGVAMEFEENALYEDGPHASIVQKFPLFDTHGKVYAVGSIVTDITERKRAKEALVASEEQFRSVLATATDAVVTIDEDSRILFANPATTRIFGFDTGELIGQPITMLMPAPKRERHAAGHARYFETVQQTTTRQAVELVGLGKDGQEFPVEVSFVAVSRHGKRLFTGFIRDLRERKHAELLIRGSEEQLRLLIDSIPQLIWTAGPDGSIDHHNERLLAYHGQPIERIQRNGAATIIHPDDRDRAADTWRQALASGSDYEVEARLLGADGEYRWFLIRGLPLRCEYRHVVKWYGTCTDIEQAVRRRQQLQQERDYLRREVREAHAFGKIVGQSEAIKEVLAQIEQVARTASAVLLIGETGTGKELLAHAIHNGSPRRERPMVALNCAALPAALVESELFGREKGAYTGALTRQVGRFELADNSTLFLDEVSELPLELQAKLLRVLQDGHFERLGCGKTLTANVRIIAATNRDLAHLVKEGRFRDDLYYRLNVFPIRVPPLRERREDIALLAWTFVKGLGPVVGKTIDSIPRQTLEALMEYAWPGNVRELRNVIERAMIVCSGSTLSIDLPSKSENARVGVAAPITLDEAQRQHILLTLEKTGWRVGGKRGAAARLGLKTSTLQSWMRRLGIVRPR